MHRTFPFSLLLTLLSLISVGQSDVAIQSKNSKAYNFDVAAVQTNILGKASYGFNFNLKYCPTKWLTSGAYFVYSQRKISDSFNYSIKKPIIQFYEIGWINQYHILNSPKIRFDATLINGFSQVRLGDNAIKDRKYKLQPKEIASNFFYMIEPGGSISYRLTSSHENADIWLIATADYRIAVGSTKYATTKDFSGSLYGLGVSIRGFDDQPRNYPTNQNL